MCKSGGGLRVVGVTVYEQQWCLSRGQIKDPTWNPCPAAMIRRTNVVVGIWSTYQWLVTRHLVHTRRVSDTKFQTQHSTLPEDPGSYPFPAYPVTEVVDALRPAVDSLLSNVFDTLVHDSVDQDRTYGGRAFQTYIKTMAQEQEMSEDTYETLVSRSFKAG